MGRRGARGGVRRLDDRRSPKPHKYLLTRSNRTRMQRSNAHWQSDPIKEIFLYIAASASVPSAFLPLLLFFPDFNIQYSFLPIFLFFFSFFTTSGHPLKISMQYLSELDVGFIINVKYSCYFKNVGRPPLCFSGFKVCLRCVPSAQGQFIHTGCSNLLKPTMLICENTSIRVV